MRFLIVLILALGLAVANAQTPSGTNTNSNSWTNTNSNSWTNSVTATVTWTPTVSITTSGTGTGTATGTYPQPPAPVGLANGCLNHIIYICAEWSDPALFTFNFYRIYYQATGGTIQVLTSTTPNKNIGGLTPATTYTIWVQGVDTGVGVWSANSTTITVTTAAADPKKDSTRDIQNFICGPSTNPVTGRVAITCTWDAAQDIVVHVNLKCHCVAASSGPTREPLFVRKKLWGSKATATSVLFAINRDNADCNIYARFYYQRRPTTRHHSFVLV